MSRTKMRQVRLRRDDRIMTGWIEDQNARKGVEVELVGDGFWVIDEVF